MADRDVTVDIIATDHTGRAAREAAENMRRLADRNERHAKAAEKASQVARRLAVSLLGVAAGAARAASKVAALASLVGPATVGMLALGRALAAAGRGMSKLGPLAAFIPGLVAAFQLLKGTLTLVGPGLARALEPITRQFVTADGGVKFALRLCPASKNVGVWLRSRAAEHARDPGEHGTDRHRDEPGRRQTGRWSTARRQVSPHGHRGHRPRR